MFCSAATKFEVNCFISQLMISHQWLEIQEKMDTFSKVFNPFMEMGKFFEIVRATEFRNFCNHTGRVLGLRSEVQMESFYSLQLLELCKAELRLCKNAFSRSSCTCRTAVIGM